MTDREEAGAEPDEPFGALVPLHLQAMLQTAAALVGAADAEDATQEAILRAWRAWDTLRDVGAVRGWLLRITIHICQDWRRGRFGTRRMRTVPLLDDDALPLAELAPTPAPATPPARSTCALPSMRCRMTCAWSSPCATTPRWTPPRSANCWACPHPPCAHACAARSNSCATASMGRTP